MPTLAPSSHRPRWTDVRARLETSDRKSLLALVHDLYEASPANRRFLEARFLPSPGALAKYHRLVSDAVFPDPLSRRRVALRDATAVITEYRRSTGDVAGTVDLMLTFIEAGTEQAADLGYGDESYFSALENKLDAVAKSWRELSPATQVAMAARLARVQTRAKQIGWGFGDYVDDVVARLRKLAPEKRARRNEQDARR